ncbi:peptidoglycan-binding protein [Candidatus Coxiella mudrowiae]|uniref:peptidoglycan-binding protein n=1 Tax=Candidatus Coxiella mudrowiae TaxID=2054173 RepID=UPI000C28E2D1
MKIYGYPIEKTGILDKQRKSVVTVFQMHFRPSNFSGIPDKETCAILNVLMCKYYPKEALLLTKEPLLEKENNSIKLSSSNLKFLKRSYSRRKRSLH